MAEMYMQESMSPDIVPLAKGKKEYKSFADWLMDPDADEQQKMNWIWQVKEFVTLNCVTKKDLQAAMRFMAMQCYEAVPVPPRLSIVKPPLSLEKTSDKIIKEGERREIEKNRRT